MEAIEFKKRLGTSKLAIAALCLVISFIALYFTLRSADKNKPDIVLETMQIGSWPYEADETKKPIEWIILEKNKDDGTAVLLSKYAIEAKPYNAMPENTADSKRNAIWEKSTLRKWLNDEFYNTAFNEQEKETIENASLTNLKGTGKFTKDFVEHWQKWDIDFSGFLDESWETSSGSDTKDKVWLLSTADIEKYTDVLALGKEMQAKPTPYTKSKAEICDSALCKKNNAYGFCNWWLRTAGYKQDDAAYIHSDGNIYSFGMVADNEKSGTVRPAIKIRLK